MPLRPFPFQLNIGTDIVHVARIRSILAKAETKPQLLERFLRRLLTPFERREFATRQLADSTEGQSRLDVISKHLAGRWAAKEATIKAVSRRRLRFHDVVLSQPSRGGPLRAVVLGWPAFDDAKGLTTDENSRRAPLFHHEGVEHTTTEDELLSRSTNSRQSHETDGSQSLSRNLGLFEAQTHGDQSFDDVSGQTVRVSVSHDGEYATAVCLAAEEPADGVVVGEGAARQPS